MPAQKVYHTPEDRIEDPREHQEWFLRLPEHAKQEMRRGWAKTEGRTGNMQKRKAQQRNRYLIEGALFWAVIFWAFYPFTSDGFLLAVGVGTAMGGAGYLLRAGYFLYAWLGVLSYFAFMLLYSGAPGGWTWVFSLVVTGFGAAALGVGHTLKRYDFSD